MRTILLALGVAVLPLAAEAQYAPCPPNPLAWPFCAAGAIVVGAATIATAPFWVLGGAPPYYHSYGYPVSAYYPPPPPAYYPPPPPVPVGYHLPPPQPEYHPPPPVASPAPSPPIYYTPRG